MVNDRTRLDTIRRELMDEDVFCKHGTPIDVHCCDCHAGCRCPDTYDADDEADERDHVRRDEGDR